MKMPPAALAATLTLWCEHPPAALPRGLDGACRLGLLNGDGAGAPDGMVVMRQVTAAPPSGQSAEAWLVPPGYGAHFGLIGALCASHGGQVVVSINGLGGKALAELRAAANGALVLGYDARPLDLFLLTEQLAWLAAQPESFAMTVGCDQQAVVALLAGASGLIVPAGVTLDLAALARITATRRPDAARPLCAAELDGLDGGEVSLTVRRALPIGSVLAQDDLDVAVVDNLGLSPALAARVAGLRLRYPIAPGEPLHFAHFEDPKP